MSEINSSLNFPIGFQNLYINDEDSVQAAHESPKWDCIKISSKNREGSKETMGINSKLRFDWTAAICTEKISKLS